MLSVVPSASAAAAAHSATTAAAAHSALAPRRCTLRRRCRCSLTTDDQDFHSCIGSVISGHFTEPWPIYKKIPESQKNFWFEELKVPHISVELPGQTDASLVQLVRKQLAY
ncbi:hypothetical protein Salat_2394000 [Sesamum alatum]|uniref:Uncharacterized protein n=1 Tax=Sesamum alatum TaxID=300844 RepID=A0AAE2CF32_9LAMI|nr:hypothetical protein Salat_2394000 [Sesamum alatum]